MSPTLSLFKQRTKDPPLSIVGVDVDLWNCKIGIGSCYWQAGVTAQYRSHDWSCDDIPANLMKRNMEVHDWIMWRWRGHMTESCDVILAYLVKHTMERSHDWIMWWHYSIPYEATWRSMTVSCDDGEVTWLDHVMTFQHTNEEHHWEVTWLGHVMTFQNTLWSIPWRSHDWNLVITFLQSRSHSFLMTDTVRSSSHLTSNDYNTKEIKTDNILFQWIIKSLVLEARLWWHCSWNL